MNIKTWAKGQDRPRISTIVHQPRSSNPLRMKCGRYLAQFKRWDDTSDPVNCRNCIKCGAV